MNPADRLFTGEQKLRIVEATRNAESRTTGEIVLLVANSSGRYYDIKVVSAVALSAVLSLLASLSVFQASFWHLAALTAALFPFCFLLLSRAETVLIGLVPHRRIEAAVRDCALWEFNKHGLHKTKGQTGVLFYISLIERRVFVYADKGIYEKITQQALNRYACDVAVGIKTGLASEALVQAITEIGGLLAANFPGLPDDVNELPDDVLSDGDK